MKIFKENQVPATFISNAFVPTESFNKVLKPVVEWNPVSAVTQASRDLFGNTGLILCPGCDAPINTKPENMEAFVAAAREYGQVA